MHSSVLARPPSNGADNSEGQRRSEPHECGSGFKEERWHVMMAHSSSDHSDSSQLVLVARQTLRSFCAA